MLYIAVFSFFISGFVLMYIIFRSLKSNVGIVDKLEAYDTDYNRNIETKIKNSDKSGPISKFARTLEKLPFNQKDKKKKILLVKQADLPLTYEEFFVFKILISTSITLLGAMITKSFLACLILFAVAWLLPSLVLKSRRKKKIVAFDHQLNEGLGMVSNALKAGYSFLQAVAIAAEETQDPFSKEFKVLLKELSLGMQMEDALSNLSDRVPSEDLKLIINAILIQKDIGGNLSEILENISETIRERQRIKNEVSSLTAQGRLSGMIIMVMPFFLGVIIYLFDNEYVLTLFNTTIGRVLIGLALFNQFLGWLFIRKIIRIEY